MATLVLCKRHVRPKNRRTAEYTYKDETDGCNYSHEDTRALAKGKRIDLHERLRGVQGEERVQVRGTEQEQDRGGKAQDTRGNDTGNDTTASDDASIFGLLCNMARRVKANHGTGGEKANSWLVLAVVHPAKARTRRASSSIQRELQFRCL